VCELKAQKPGKKLREDLKNRDLISLIGVFDLFSATIAASHFDALFLSGFGFAASYYGLPDIGFIAWTDIVAWVQRVRLLFPSHHIVVDIDDGYCDVEVACHVVVQLEKAGASAVVIEDQRRPRKCGHFEGKQILELEDYIIKLKKVLSVRKEMMVIARTDTSEFNEIRKRVNAFHEAGADAILVDALKDLNLIRQLKQECPTYFMFNQIAGGKSKPCSWSDLKDVGISLVNYSTPCLFAVQTAMNAAMENLKQNDGKIEGGVSVAECSKLLFQNLERRDSV